MVSALTEFWVDTDWCTAHYLCIDLAPVFFEMREGAWAASIRRTDFSAMSAEETDSVFWAAAHCPVAAIKVRLCSGEIIDAESPLLKKLSGRLSPDDLLVSEVKSKRPWWQFRKG